MERISRAVSSDSIENLNAVLRDVRVKSIQTYLEAYASRDIHSDVTIMTIMLDKLSSDHYGHDDHDGKEYYSGNKYVKIIRAAFDQVSKNNLKIMLKHPTFTPNANLNNYIKGSPSECFSLLLNSEKFGANQDTLDVLFGDNNPDKINMYMKSSKFVGLIPSREGVGRLAKKYHGYHASLSILFDDDRIDLSSISSDNLKEWVSGNQNIILDVLKRRIPDIINPMILHKTKQNIVTNSFFQNTLKAIAHN
jgi:hypothetical protein